MGALRYLEQFGVTIAENGYEVIPIRPGHKRPYGEDWETYAADPAAIRQWIKVGKGSFGIGIRTKDAPGVDIDTWDASINRHMIAYTEKLVGKTLQRTGQKGALLAYRTSKPFPKIQTPMYLDEKRRIVKLEVLADGQQYVAAHIHPDTGKPYVWKDRQSPLKVKLADLPEITQEQAEAIRDEFVRLAEEKVASGDWQLKSKALQRMSRGTVDEDDPFANVSRKTDISDEELHAKLLMVPSNEDYDTWFHIGMALWHQYDGSDYGLELWHEWSADAPNYDPKALDSKWSTFNIEQKGRQPITARFIIKQANDEATRLRTEELQTVREQLGRAPDLDDLIAVCEKIKHIAFSQPIREMLTGLVKDAFKRVTGTAPRIGAVRDMIRYENPDFRQLPKWAKPFAYVTFDTTFYDTATRQSLSHRAFDSAFGRFMLTKKDVAEGRAAPEHSPTDVVLHQFQIPVVFNRMYLPGADQFFTHAGIRYVNAFSDEGYPEIPGRLSPPEKRAVAIVLAHFEHLIRNPRDRRLFIDFLAYVIQNPGKRINWAILIQGAEGDGKSFFSDLLSAILGWENINIIGGDALEEKYTPWAERAMVCFVEDVRLHGANRYAAINKLKPYLTNTSVPIRRMNVDIYKVVNTISYILTANIKDAIPEGEEGSRYFPMFSVFQSQAAVRKFKAANPDYYKRVWATLEYAGALRKHFLEHEISVDFDPNERAPISSNRAEMVALNKSEEDEALEDSLAESEMLDYCDLLLDSTKLPDEFTGRDAVAPYGKALARLLSTNGFTLLGRFKVDGKPHRYWSRHPEAWEADNQERLGEQIREYLDPRGL